MARIVVGSYMVRYPLGGMMSWTLQWLLGLKQLGHEVVFVEKSTYEDSCYNPTSRTSSNNPAYGLQTVSALLSRFELKDGICYVDFDGNYHGIEQRKVEEVFCSADLFLDLGTHGAWLEEANASGILTALVDGEPGYTQVKLEKQIARGEATPEYDFYFSNGANIGTAASSAPTGGQTWRPVFNPVVTALFPVDPPTAGTAFTTVMNWQSHAPFEYQGTKYGQKNVEFSKFIDLPAKTTAHMEVAVSGKSVPASDLASAGWRLRDAQEVTVSFDAYREYIRGSLGEFSVCKNIFVVAHTGWFSDRSAAYLASGRPVVLQNTGFSDHLPTGEGLFAVDTLEEAAAAIDEIERDYSRHAYRARQIAEEHLEAQTVLKRFLGEVGVA